MEETQNEKEKRDAKKISLKSKNKRDEIYGIADRVGRIP